MLNMDSEIVKSLKASAFTLIVAFVCVALVGLALIPLLPVKLNPSRTLPGFTVRFSMPGTSGPRALPGRGDRHRGGKNVHSLRKDHGQAGGGRLAAPCKANLFESKR